MPQADEHKFAPGISQEHLHFSVFADAYLARQRDRFVHDSFL
jgi:hypothetical protein